MQSFKIRSAITHEQFKKTPDTDSFSGLKEDMPSIIRPTGCAPIGPVNWMALRTYDRIIETREEQRPSYSLETIGCRTIARCWQRGCAIAKEYERNDQSDALYGSNWRKERLKRLTHVISHIRSGHWHMWMFPIGPIVFTECNDKSTNIPISEFSRPYWVCWADVVYLFHCRHYISRFMNVYHMIIWFMEHDANLLYVPNDEQMTALRYTYAFASLHLHIQIIAKQNRDIGGMWSETLDHLRNLQKVLHRRFADATGEIMNTFCNQFSVKSVKEWGNCGRNSFPGATEHCPNADGTRDDGQPCKGLNPGPVYTKG